MKRKMNPLEVRLTSAEVRKIIAEQKRHFPGDSALQQVHISRAKIHLEAEKCGMNYVDYILFRNRAEAN